MKITAALVVSINSRQTPILRTASMSELPEVGRRYKAFRVKVQFEQTLEKSSLRRRHARWMTQEQRLGIRKLSSARANGLCDVSVLRDAAKTWMAGAGCWHKPANLWASYLLAQNKAKVRHGVWLVSLPGPLCLLELEQKLLGVGTPKREHEN